MGNEILIHLEKDSDAFEWKTGDFIIMVPKAHKEISKASDSLFFLHHTLWNIISS